MFSASRRRFLLAAGGITATAAGVAVYRSLRVGDVGAHLHPQLKALITAGHFSPDLGAKYLEDLGFLPHAPFALLHDEVMDGLPGRSDRLLVEIGGKVEQDFAEGRICRIDGWQLSATECRLAALAFLFQQAGGRIDAPAAEELGPISELPEAAIAQLERWGPRSATVGEGFNVTPDGSSALWFRFAEIDPQPYEIYFGASPLRTTLHPSRNLITATVTKRQVRRLTSEPGEIPIHLVNTAQGSKQLMGRFQVRPKSDESGRGISEMPEAAIAQLERWGPRSATVGEGFNVQPNGSSALWFSFAEIDPQPYEIYFGASPLRTTLHPSRNLITATVTKRQVRRLTSEPGEIPIHLVNTAQGSKQLMGRFQVRPKRKTHR